MNTNLVIVGTVLFVLGCVCAIGCVFALTILPRLMKRCSHGMEQEILKNFGSLDSFMFAQALLMLVGLIISWGFGFIIALAVMWMHLLR